MKSIVAIEICPDAIRAAEILKPMSKSPKVAKVGEIVIPGGIAGESQILNVEVMVEALKQLWVNEMFTTKDVILVVSGRRFITRAHETAHTSLSALAPVLGFEAATVIPEGMARPIIDFFPMFHSEAKGGVKTSGLVIATPSEPIEQCVAALVGAELNLRLVDFAPMAIARFIKNNIPSEDYGLGYAVVNIRERSTDILIAKGNIPRMVRVAAVGLKPIGTVFGKHFVEEEDQSLDITHNSTYKEPSPIEMLANEIKTSVTSQIDALGISLDRLYVTGPRSDEKTVKALTSLLKMRVTALPSTPINSVGELDKQLVASEFVAICAGMRGNVK